MARNLETISLTLRPETLRALDAAAHADRRSRSAVVDLMIQRSLITGESRLRTLNEVAADGLQTYAAAHGPRERANPGEIIAESSVDGRRHRAALDEIAKGAKR
jgi:hypothetical protein